MQIHFVFIIHRTGIDVYIERRGSTEVRAEAVSAEVQPLYILSIVAIEIVASNLLSVVLMPLRFELSGCPNRLPSVPRPVHLQNACCWSPQASVPFISSACSACDCSSITYRLCLRKQVSPWRDFCTALPSWRPNTQGQPPCRASVPKSVHLHSILIRSFLFCWCCASPVQHAAHGV